MSELIRKLKIYLDTSILSYLKQDDNPERTGLTLKFWEELKNRDDVELYISDVALTEVDQCYEEKRIFMREKLKELSFVFLEKDVNAENLAQRIIDLGILTNKSYDDCLHIAIAILADCNYIASWNFKHLVNVKTINGVRAITNLSGFNPIDIVTPEMLLKENENG